MQIIIDGKPAALKKDSSFEYVSENRYFTDSDDYSLSITLPLRGCSQNLAIFGNINRIDFSEKQKVMDCEIRDSNFVKKGVIAITELTQAEVKIQFLADRSIQNYNQSLDDIYINELDLGEPDSVSKNDYTVLQAWGYDADSPNYMKYLAIPWVNNNSDSGFLNNEADYDSKAGSWSWNSTNCKGLSFMPYMRYLAETIARAVGYEPDFSKWGESCWQYLLCCNTLPYSWDKPGFATALPHWTVKEFFQQLEFFMRMEFDFDFYNQTITLVKPEEKAAAEGTVELTEILDEFSFSCENVLQDEDEQKKPQLYKYASNSSYAEMWNSYTCDWLIEKYRAVISKKGVPAIAEMTLGEFYARDDYNKKGMIRVWWDNPYSDSVFSSLESQLEVNPHPQIFYISTYDTYYIRKWGDIYKESETDAIHDYYLYVGMQPIAFLSSWLSDDDEEDATEIKILPAIIADTDKGDCVFIMQGEIDEVNDNDNQWYRYYSKQIKDGEVTSGEEYLSQMYAAIAWQHLRTDDSVQFCPVIDKAIGRKNDMEIGFYDDLDVSFRLDQNRKYSDDISFKDLDTSQKYTFKFLSDSLPSARAVFVINSQRYLCEKLTATFTERGMSRLIKGVFYRVKDD
jgi:hypothetical protein